MQEEANTTNEQHARPGSPNEPRVRGNAQEDLVRLRDELYRLAHDVRMKSKGAGAEVQDTQRMLESEVLRFGAEIDQAVEKTQDQLRRLGDDLRARYQKLANQIALPPK
jgi:predicted translin family RNA/ssDNA-binding protein